jgi:homoserine acetyltransferase
MMTSELSGMPTRSSLVQGARREEIEFAVQDHGRHLDTPRRNAAGEITNAVVINSYYSGDSTDMYEQWYVGAALSGGVPIIGPGRPIDTDRYYVVMVDPLGTWSASKPSDGLGIKFPQYTYFDMVQANYRMLRDHLKIARVALATGVSMGGTQTYVWGAGGRLRSSPTKSLVPSRTSASSSTSRSAIRSRAWSGAARAVTS